MQVASVEAGLPGAAGWWHRAGTSWASVDSRNGWHPGTDAVIVVDVETTAKGSDSQDARAALEQAQRVEKAVRGVKTPWWYWVLSAALFAALILTQLLGERYVVYLLAVAMVIVAMNLLTARKTGVIGGFSRNVGFLVAMLGVFLVVVTSIVWFEVAGQRSVLLMAGVAAVLVLVAGWLYRRNPS